jgi:CheY-like chemotaxis protein
MVLDDDPGRRRALYEILRIIGIDILSAASGAEAMQRVPSEQPDLILVNLWSEKAGGIEFIRDLRRYGQGQKIPVFALVEAEPEKRTHATAAGANELLDPDPVPYALIEMICDELEVDTLKIPPALRRPDPVEEARLARQGKLLGVFTLAQQIALPSGSTSRRLKLTSDAGKNRKG